MIRCKYILILLVVFSISHIACKTTPKAVEPSVDVGEYSEKKKNEVLSEQMAKEAEMARARAVENGADKSHVSLFEKADEVLRLARDVSIEDNKTGIKRFEKAMNMYYILSNLAECLEYKKEIDENKFQDYDIEKYSEAELFYAQAIEKYNSGELSSLSDSQKCLSLYKSLYDKGYFEFANSAKKLAREAKEKCDSIKASRSMAKSYNEAVGLYNTGNVYIAEKNYKAAYKSYVASGDVFTETYNTVEEKRKEAVMALERAKEKLKASSSLASEADKISPLEEVVEGFGELDSSDLENRDSKKENVDKINDDEEN